MLSRVKSADFVLGDCVIKFFKCRGFCHGGFCLGRFGHFKIFGTHKIRGILSWCNFFMGGFVMGDYVFGDFVHGGFCHRGFCHGGLCLTSEIRGGEKFSKIEFYLPVNH